MVIFLIYFKAVCHKNVPCLCKPGPFGLKTGIHFAHFGPESGMVVEGTTGAHELSYRFNFKKIRIKQKYANSKRALI